MKNANEFRESTVFVTSCRHGIESWIDLHKPQRSNAMNSPTNGAPDNLRSLLPRPLFAVDDGSLKL